MARNQKKNTLILEEWVRWGLYSGLGTAGSNENSSYSELYAPEMVWMPTWESLPSDAAIVRLMFFGFDDISYLIPRIKILFIFIKFLLYFQMHQADRQDPTKSLPSLKSIPLNISAAKKELSTQYQPTPVTLSLHNQLFTFEALGVFIFVFGTNCFHEGSEMGINIHFVSAIFLAFVMCNHPSNSNINPAVTFGFCLRRTKRYQLGLLWLYFKAQFTGAFVAYAVTYLVNGVYRPPLEPQTKGSPTEYWRIILSESFAVFVLILTILQITGPNTSYCSSRFQKYIFIAIFVYLGRCLCPGSYHGLNLSLTAARALLGMFFYNLEGLRYIYLWGLGDIIGTVIAVLFYNFVLEPHIIAARIDHILHEQEHEDKEAVQLAELTGQIKLAQKNNLQAQEKKLQKQGLTKY